MANHVPLLARHGPRRSGGGHHRARHPRITGATGVDKGKPVFLIDLLDLSAPCERDKLTFNLRKPEMTAEEQKVMQAMARRDNRASE